MNRRFSLLLVPLVAAVILFPRATPRPAADSRHGSFPGGIETDQQRTGAPLFVSPGVSSAGTDAVASGVAGGGAPHPSSKLGDRSCPDPPNCGEPTAKPKPLTVKAASISGIASWYDYIPGGAAAGPRLRAFLGPHWRGAIVRVCAGSECVVAQLSDWCACNTGAEKLIDLDKQLFAALAPLSQGIVNVEVRAIR